MTDDVVAHTLSCAEFLERHSEYLDGVLPEWERPRFETHVSGCAACSRYDQVVRRGGELLQQLPDLEVSDRFELRLQHRLLHEDEARRQESSRSGLSLTGAMLIAGALAAVAWSPLLHEGITREERAAASRAATAASGAAPATVDWALDRHRAVAPLFKATLLGTTSAAAPLFLPVGADAALRPGPYSPLIVNPPGFRIAAQSTPLAAE